MRNSPLTLLLCSTTTVFTFLSLGLGEYYDMYERVPWWDLFLHFKSGWIVSIVVSYLVLKHTAISNATGTALIAVSCSMAVGMQWEIFEFFMDTFLDTNMQKSGSDTMTDLIADSIGAVIGSIAAYRLYIGHNNGYVLKYLGTITGRFK